MKPIRLFLGVALLSMSILCINNAYAQHRGNSGNHRTEKTSGKRSTGNVNRNNSASKSSFKGNNGPEKSKATTNSSNRPGHSKSISKPTQKKETTKADNHKDRGSRKGNDKKVDKQTSTRQANHGRPGSNNRVNKHNSGHKPEGNHRHDNDKKRNDYGPKSNNPGHRPDDGKKPGNNNPKPKDPGHKPNHDPGHKPHNHGPQSAPKPGSHPHDHYKRHDYHPPHPNGGHWGPPPPNTHHWTRPLPPPPPPHSPCYHGAPPISMMFGLAFGTFIDYSINSLLYNGYNVLGYANNIVYLTSVTQLGYQWDDVEMYFNDGLFSSAYFQDWSSSPSQARFNSVYSQLCTLYGPPVSNSNSHGIKSFTWWGGNQTGYVTLEYGHGMSDSGYPGYFTTLIYGSNY